MPDTRKSIFPFPEDEQQRKTLLRFLNRSDAHRVIILNGGRMFAFEWREFSLLLSFAHRLLPCYHRQKRYRRRCNSRAIPPQPLATRVIGQWAHSLDSRVTSRCDVAQSGQENLHQFLPILLWRHALSSSIMTLCWCPRIQARFSLRYTLFRACDQ